MIARVVALVAVWLLTLAGTEGADVIVGAVLAVAVAVWLRPPEVGSIGTSATARLAGTPALVWVVLVDVVQGTWDVALRVLGLRTMECPGLVLVPIGERTALGIAATGLLFGLSPGSVLIEVDDERRAMVWHVVDARDPDAVRARFERFYDRYQRRVIP